MNGSKEPFFLLQKGRFSKSQKKSKKIGKRVLTFFDLYVITPLKDKESQS